MPSARAPQQLEALQLLQCLLALHSLAVSALLLQAVRLSVQRSKAEFSLTMLRVCFTVSELRYMLLRPHT